MDAFLTVWAERGDGMANRKWLFTQRRRSVLVLFLEIKVLTMIHQYAFRAIRNRNISLPKKHINSIRKH